MSGMLERAAIAVMAAGDRCTDYGGNDLLIGPSAAKAIARAVLMAIREPNDAMVGCDSSAWFYAGSQGEDVWKSCIDVILADHS